MELLFATLGGAILGIAANYPFPGRETRGYLLIPAIGASVAAVVWAALTWVGWRFDGGWIWVVTLVAAGIVAGVASLLIGRGRTASDVSMLATLSRA